MFIAAVGVTDFDRTFVMVHGVFEVVLASALIVGLFIRLAALLLAVQLVLIVPTL